MITTANLEMITTANPETSSKANPETITTDNPKMTTKTNFNENKKFWGSTYVRWGRKVCPESSSLVYAGKLYRKITV